MSDLKGRVALVTGGAIGIGAACCEALAADGATVIVTDIDETKGRETADALGCDFHKLDVTSEEEWIAVVEAITQAHGGVDILVNNAGIVDGMPLEMTSYEQWRKQMAINLDGVFLGIKSVLPAMKPRMGQWEGGAAIINIASIMSMVTSPLASAYCASKGAVMQLTKQAALEFATLGYKIRVNSVHPGYIETALVDGAAKQFVQLGVAGSDNEVFDGLVEQHPIGRLGRPIEIANAVAYLASDKASFMTGSPMVVDGGFTTR